MSYEKTAGLLFAHIKESPADIEKKYPPRDLPAGACVTRTAPSPTGFMHLGNLWNALIGERLARRSGGVFYLRIEDTDQKREVEGGVEKIFDMFGWLGLKFDESIRAGGEYGPYAQSKRGHIYGVFAKYLVSEGKAYPCFCSPEELEQIKGRQQAAGDNTGYYGKWARCRDLGFEQIERRVSAGDDYIIRFKSPGDEGRRISVNDLIKGLLDPPENIRDEVVLKSDGLPTYHFAHVVDDRLMGTTHVIRGDEWLATLPIHVQIFEAFGWEPPHFMHHAVLLKQEGESKRKLSKRKDPELSLDYYSEAGYLPECLKEYIMTLLNSNYEEWRIASPQADMREFEFTAEKLSPSGALFDLDKLNDISRNYIAQLTTDEIYNHVINWAQKYDADFAGILSGREDYAKSILGIGRGVAKPRKDIGMMSELKNYMGYFYGELFEPDYRLPESIRAGAEVIKNIARDYIGVYDGADEQGAWFDKIKALAAAYNFAPDMKLYKKDPEAYAGSVADVSMILRVAVCGRQNAPDMYEVFKIMGRDIIAERLERFAGEV